MARWLIERGADVNARAAIDAQGFGGHTPLFHTVVNLASGMGLDDDSKARLLLDHGADPNARATFRQEEKTHGKAPTEYRRTGLGSLRAILRKFYRNGEQV